MKPIDFAPVRVLTVGDIMLDRYWFGDVQRVSPEAPVPIVHVRRTDERLGGAANVARNVVELGAGSTLIGVIGDDEPGLRVEQMAQALGIQCRLTRDVSLPTTIKLRIIGRQQQLLRRVLAANVLAVRQGVEPAQKLPSLSISASKVSQRCRDPPPNRF